MSSNWVSGDSYVTYKGQTYARFSEKSYIRRDGTQTTLIVWRTRCAECGEPMTVMTPSGARNFSPNRRCEIHKKPGVRVKKKSHVKA